MNRRWLLAVALVAMVALAGCVGGLGDGDADDADLIEYVSADAEAVVGAEMSVVEDEESTTAFEAVGAPFLGTGDADLEETLDEFEAETGLDPYAVGGLLAYTVDDEPVLILRADWAEDDLIEAVEEDEMIEYEAEEHAGHTVYTPADEQAGHQGEIGVIDDGVYVLGPPDLVRTTLEVSAGDADALDGQLRTAYDEASGAVVAAVEVNDEDIPPTGPAGEIDPAPLRDVQVVGVGYTSGDGSVALDATLYATSESAASDVEAVLDGLLGWAIETTPDEALTEELQAIEVSQNGDRVLISYEGDVETLDEIEAV